MPYPELKEEIVGMGIARLGPLGGTAAMVGRPSFSLTWPKVPKLLTVFANSSPSSFILFINNRVMARSHILSSASWVSPSEVLVKDDRLVEGLVGEVGEEGGCMSL